MCGWPSVHAASHPLNAVFCAQDKTKYEAKCDAILEKGIPAWEKAAGWKFSDMCSEAKTVTHYLPDKKAGPKISSAEFTSGYVVPRNGCCSDGVSACANDPVPTKGAGPRAALALSVWPPPHAAVIGRASPSPRRRRTRTARCVVTAAPAASPARLFIAVCSARAAARAWRVCVACAADYSSLCKARATTPRRAFPRPLRMPVRRHQMIAQMLPMGGRTFAATFWVVRVEGALAVCARWPPVWHRTP